MERLVSPVLGARLTGYDLRAPTDADIVRIERALDEHGVVVLPGQRLSPLEQLALGRRFGPVEEHPLGHVRDDIHDGTPGIHLVRVVKPESHNEAWHADMTWMERPPKYSVLNCHRAPSRADQTVAARHGEATRGATQFCSLTRAFESLSPGLRLMLEGLNVVHANDINNSNHAATATSAIPQQQIHPCVRWIPGGGGTDGTAIAMRKALFVNPSFTTQFEGFTREESEPLLRYLFEQAALPEHVFSHHWAPDDCVIWDNSQVWHRVQRDYDDTAARRMHRVCVTGLRPAGPSDPRGAITQWDRAAPSTPPPRLASL